MTESAETAEFDRRTIFVPAGAAGNATIRKARQEGWEQTASVKEQDGRFRIELQRPKGYESQTAALGATGSKSRSVNTVLGLVLLAAIAAFVVYFAIQLFSKDDTAAPAAVSNSDYDRGRCQKMARDFEKYRQEKLIPIVNAGTAAGAGSFRAISGDTQTVIDTMDKWSSGIRDATLAGKFTTAISSGRAFLAVAAGSESTDTVASAAAKWVGDANTAFTGCPQ